MKAEIFVFIGCVILCVLGENKTFTATKNWKTVEDGQAIPSGLHVRVNLQTGKKEAKLLDEEEKKSAMVEVKDDRLDPEEMKEFLKKFKGDDVKEEKAFRSYEELKREFENLNVDVKTDLEIMMQLMQDFRNLIETPPEDNEVFLALLTDLEYLVHQYDNAMEFARLGGFTLVVKFLNMTSDYKVREEVLHVLGSSVQNNPRVQLAAVNAGCVTVLLKLLVVEQNPSVKLRALYAISCLIRNFPPAQLKFVKDGGITVFSQLFDDPKTLTDKTKTKIINLLSDLLTEIQNSGDDPKLKEKYELLSLELNLREQGWCQRVADWFSHRENFDGLDNDLMETTVDLLVQLSEPCLADFVINIELLNAVNRARQLYSDLTLHELDDGITDSIHSQILDKLRNLAAIFARTTQFKDEL